jgi:methionyl aminopeptidase
MIKNSEEIKKIKIASRLASQVLEYIEPYVKAGTTTNDIDKKCHDFIVHEQKAIPAPLNYHGFPKSICTSINHQVCHGIPSEKKLKNGDIINIDVAVIKDKYHGDTSKMFSIGKISKQAEIINTISQQCLYKAIKIVKPGVFLGSIGNIIQEHAEKNRCSVVREYCGHGIGLFFHEEPQILHYGKKNTGIRLREGMTFTIEPMINFGKRDIKLLNDNWTVVTKDRCLSAQWEHTLLVVKNGVEVLTKRKEETIFNEM